MPTLPYTITRDGDEIDVELEFEHQLRRIQWVRVWTADMDELRLSAKEEAEAVEWIGNNYDFDPED